MELDRKPMRTFLVTGATDGIGLTTVKTLAEQAPDVNKDEDVRIIGIHGRYEARVNGAAEDVIEYAKYNKKNFKIVKFVYDLADYGQISKFIDDVLSVFHGE